VYRCTVAVPTYISRQFHERSVFSTLCLKRIPDIIDCNLEKDYQIMIMLGTNISDTMGHQMIIQVLISPNVCFWNHATTWKIVLGVSLFIYKITQKLVEEF